MGKRTEAQAAFGLRLAADLLTVLTITGVLSKEHAMLLIDESRTKLLEDEPDLAPQIQEISAVLIAQIQLGHAELQRQLRELDDDED